MASRIATRAMRPLVRANQVATAAVSRGLASRPLAAAVTRVTPVASCRPLAVAGVRRTVPLVTQPKRHLNLHEYQSKALMAKFGIRVQKGKIAETKEEALRVAKELVEEKAAELVVKSQIHAGGRGKGTFNTGFKGGVKVTVGANRAAEAAELSGKMLGNSLITNQTGKEGQLVKKVLIHEGITFTSKNEKYFAIVMDRDHQGPVIIVSPQGGVDIEEVAHSNPSAITTIPVDIHQGVQDAQLEKAARVLGFTGKQIADAKDQMARLYKMFIACDATQVEINPFVLTEDGLVYCVDAKINFDDNASFRQTALFDQRDFSMEDPREVEASKSNLNYIGLDGNIGCMVNGAGLAMATMDIIKLHGGAPANFLDVGGGANEQQVEEAFKILTADPSVKALLVNIFGGIMKCDTIATGIVNAAKKVKLSIPLVVRLEGTNVQLGVDLLAKSGLPIITARDLDDAAKKAVAALSKK